MGGCQYISIETRSEQGGLVSKTRVGGGVLSAWAPLGCPPATHRRCIVARDSKITITITIAEAEALLIAALEQQVVFPENRDLERGKMACSKAIHDHCENGYTQEPTPFELLGTPTLRRCDCGS